MHIRWQREKPACAFVSQCAEFTLDSLQKADLFGSPQQTSADIRRRLPTKPSLFKSDYFHLISHQYEMGSYERAQFMVHWAAVFKEECINRGSPRCPLTLGEEPVLATVCWAVRVRKDNQFKANVYIHSWWVFVLKWGASVPHADSKLQFSHGVEMWQLFVGMKAWRKRGFFMVWVRCESSFTSRSTLLQMNQIQWHYGVNSPRVKQTRLIVFSIFSTLRLPLLVRMSSIFVLIIQILCVTCWQMSNKPWISFLYTLH